MTDGNNFRGQLALYFPDCPATQAAARTAAFSAPDLVSLVQTYNTACSPTRQPGRSLLAQAQIRRRVALRGGLLAGARYNRIDYRTDGLLVADPTCANCRFFPLGGLYAELIQPGRTGALFGEFLLSTFRAPADFQHTNGNQPTTYSTFTFSTKVATARLGVRYSFPLPHEQQWLFSASYELSRTINPRFSAVRGVPYTPVRDDAYYPIQTLLPALGLGWRTGPLTLSADGLLLSDGRAGEFLGFFVSQSFVLRTSLAYRLGRNPDQAAPRTTVRP
ncbi:hypothetical protein SAMN02745146_2670 [Hymenobacter daecheongensis DSM 21074]|uniref:Uncharacterized protein n=1 Tax=Hymenobacter daecheongensis DSM 21074 TaxID=1121955 RepID=A0A1M6HWH1_9BACT|nr:hypothetical protein [Hymenobacter daecheongensis]SHJ26417.1 hypothetical protein SAMN02745146_2670 [Hymenobacter daecheongensis DSM 21074]